jgi:hypothetical protein
MMMKTMMMVTMNFILVSVTKVTSRSTLLNQFSEQPKGKILTLNSIHENDFLPYICEWHSEKMVRAWLMDVVEFLRKILLNFKQKRLEYKRYLKLVKILFKKNSDWTLWNVKNSDAEWDDMCSEKTDLKVKVASSWNVSYRVIFFLVYEWIYLKKELIIF